MCFQIFKKKKVTHYFKTVLDQDRNGILDENDFIEIGESMCILWAFKPMTDDYNRVMDQCKENWVMFKKHFESESGNADVDHFLKFFDKILSPGNEKMYRDFITDAVGDVFDSFDLNKDGVISINEYVDMFMCYHIPSSIRQKLF